MRLTDFILGNIEPILEVWESFARSIWPSALTDPANYPTTLRDHAAVILRSIAEDMRSAQTSVKKAAESKGTEHATGEGQSLNQAPMQHEFDRFGSGLDLGTVIAEYRALRASVLQLWRTSDPKPDLNDLEEVTRFNESIDQSLTRAVRSYTDRVQLDRETLLKNERSAREEAKSANRAKDQFLATLSHEMRTPLNAIVGWLSILRLPDRSEANLAEGLTVIGCNTMAQVQLIEDMLDLSRIISGKMRLEIRDCDLVKTINAGIDVVRPTAQAREITLDAELDPTATHASADAARIQQIVWNLLSNAIKFSNRGGSIRITLDRERSSYRMVVSDNGEGISPEILPYVFDRFRQADSSTRRRHSGLGLGLSLVKHLTELHGGTAEAQSAGEGYGATFIVRLPIQAVRAREYDHGVLPAEPRNAGFLKVDPQLECLDGLRVLVVDDQAFSRHMLDKVLTAVGARVATAASAAEALEALASGVETNNCPEVLISDVGMPEQDGYDLIREVRKRGHHAATLPAVALTAFASKDDVRDAVTAGFQMHIPKPVDVRDLIAALGRLSDAIR